MYTHPARSYEWTDLIDGIEKQISNRYVSHRVSHDGLWLFNYTDAATYDRAWNEFTLMARGLIVDPVSEKIVATPFGKFFNFGERDTALPDEPFDVFEKLDGSLIIIFHHNGQWRTATRGSFDSEQAKWAARWLERFDLRYLCPGTTYLAEATYPENRIVVAYDRPALTFLAAFMANGAEMDYEDLLLLGEAIGMPVAHRHHFKNIDDIVAHAATLTHNEEGFVVRYDNGYRIKIKGAEYRRIHGLISRVTPLGVWNCMVAGDNLEVMRREIPEETWQDFDRIVALLDTAEIELEIAVAAGRVSHLSDKEVGLLLPTFSEVVRRFIFGYRKNRGNLHANEKTRRSLLNEIRPTGNILSGYAPSFAMNRVLNDGE